MATGSPGQAARGKQQEPDGIPQARGHPQGNGKGEDGEAMKAGRAALGVAAAACVTAAALLARRRKQRSREERHGEQAPRSEFWSMDQRRDG